VLKNSVNWGVTLQLYAFIVIAEVGKPAAQFYGYIWDGNYQRIVILMKYLRGVYVLKETLQQMALSRDKIQARDIKYQRLKWRFNI